LQLAICGWRLRVSVEFQSEKQECSHSSQFTSSFGSQTRFSIPAAIAGVTLRLECTRQKL
jgi:hypothetical protein